MSIISKSLLSTSVIHSIFFVTTFASGYLKATNYKLDWDAAWANIEYLPTEVTFGDAYSFFCMQVSF